MILCLKSFYPVGYLYLSLNSLELISVYMVLCIVIRGVYIIMWLTLENIVKFGPQMVFRHIQITFIVQISSTLIMSYLTSLYAF